MGNGSGSVATIGAYDGVHIGHRCVIETVKAIARDEGLRSVIVTFDRHPATVVRPESAPKLLTDLDQKLELLRASGVDDIVVVAFDAEEASKTAEDFVDETLVGELSAKVVVVGRDFHFGKGRGGDVGTLRAMGGERGFRVVPFELIEDTPSAGAVSSTRIRRLVSAGLMAEAALLLGRPYEVRGHLNGREVAVPDEILLPATGTYDALVGAAGGSGHVARLAVDVPGPSGRLALSEAAPSLRSGPVRICFPGTSTEGA